MMSKEITVQYTIVTEVTKTIRVKDGISVDNAINKARDLSKFFFAENDHAINGIGTVVGDEKVTLNIEDFDVFHDG